MVIGEGPVSGGRGVKVNLKVKYEFVTKWVYTKRILETNQEIYRFRYFKGFDILT